jgi:hypothetical protein
MRALGEEAFEPCLKLWRRIWFSDAERAKAACVRLPGKCNLDRGGLGQKSRSA